MKNGDFNNNNQTSVYTLNSDGRASTSVVVDSLNKGITGYKYDEFGGTEVLGNATFENEVCYTGQVYDKETGDYYYNVRYYNPEDGRFVTADTYRGEFEEPQSLHLYAYCANNPINFTDPSGHSAVWLLDNEGANGFGHVSGIFGSKGTYYYTWWGKGRKAWNCSIPKGSMKTVKKINNYIISKGRKKYPRPTSGPSDTADKNKGKYNSGILFYGSFGSSLKYFKNREHNYSVTFNNCAQVTIDALKKGKFTKKDGTSETWAVKRIQSILTQVRRFTSPNEMTRQLKSALKSNYLGTYYKIMTKK